MRTFSSSILKIHPCNYINLPEPIIFFLNDRNSEADAMNIMRLLGKAKTLIITGFQQKDESWAYNLYLGDMILSMREGADNSGATAYNFNLERSRHENVARKNLYQHGRFTIIPGAGVRVIYQKRTYVASGKSMNDDWHMTEEVYKDLIERMETYFISGDEEPVQPTYFKVSRKFERNVLKPFGDYTDKEHQVELKQQADKESVGYFKRRFVKMASKGPVYDFFSEDILDEYPENQMLSEGDRVNILSDSGTGPCSGILGEIDNASGDYVVYTISFFNQFDDTALPASGRLTKMVNDTQTKVRAKVRKKLERNQVESKYMYRTFSDFSTDGYEEPEESLAEYLVEKLQTEFPPNQMQMEAIIKGILTKDVLLVLGPPGTGKTSVISLWVEYFIKQGKRVLISSQNNAAVDNVLERFRGKGEIVRLGNENKVQENCKELLPFNKIKSMNQVFDDNCVRVHAAIEKDAQAITEYAGRLHAYLELIVNYRTLYISSLERLRDSSVRLEQIHDAWARVTETLQAVETTIEQRAQKQVFLEESAKKNLLVRLLISGHVRRAKRQLHQTDKQLEDQRKAYCSAVKNYNSAVEFVKSGIDCLRRDHLLERMKEARKAAWEYTRDYVDTGVLSLHLESELSSQYDSPVFLPNPDDNHHTILDELEKMERLEKSCVKTKAALKDWYAAVNAGRNDIFQNVLLETCQIVGATCIGINSNRDFANVKFDVSIVDESGQIQIHNALIPMSRAPKNLLLGDYKQIPPCANDMVVQACREDDISTELLNKSFFEYLFTQMRKKTMEQMDIPEEKSDRLLQPVLDDYMPNPDRRYSTAEVWEMIERVTADKKKMVNLNSQFRMPGNISDVISEWFYESNYFSSYDMKRFMPMISGTDKPMVVISTSDHRDRFEAQPESKMGYYNAFEAELAADLVERTIQSLPEVERETFCKAIADQIGVISAYGAQVRVIRERLRKRCPYLDPRQIQSMVASLDSFQGQERPLIIYSLTRSTVDIKPHKGRVGFMKELRRLNVAFTRSKKQLVILGDIDYLCKCLNTENRKDEHGEKKIWPCEASDVKEPVEIGHEQIKQCEACSAACERKFARFMCLLMQHVRAGSGNLILSEDYLHTKMKR